MTTRPHALLIALCLIASTAFALGDADVLLYAPMDGDIAPSPAHGAGSPEVTGAPAFVAGKRGQAVVCGGQDGLSLSYPTAGNLLADRGALALWLQPVDWHSGDGKHHMFAVLNGEPTTILYIFLSLQTFFLQLTPDGRNPHVGSEMAWKTGEWHHLVATWQEGEFCLYADGVLQGRDSETMSLPAKLGDYFDIASGSWGAQDRTAVDELLTFRRALTPEEVAALYKFVASPPAGATGPVPKFTDAPVMRASLRHFPSAGRVEVTLRATGVGIPAGEQPSVDAALQDAAGHLSSRRSARVMLGKPTRLDFDVNALSPGAYRVHVEMSAAGKRVATDDLPFERRPKPEWLGNKLATEDQVPIPWSPVQARQAGTTGVSVGCWGREYAFDGPLCRQVTTQGEQLLADAMAFRLAEKGKPASLSRVAGQIAQRHNQSVTLGGTGNLGGFFLTTRTRVEFDGFTWIEAELTPPAGGADIDSLAFEMPLAAAHATLFYSGVYYPSLDNGTGAIKPEGFKGTWRNWFWVGDERGGIEWFAEDNRGWVITKPGEALTISPAADRTVVRLNIVDKPTTIAKPIKIAFGFQATPVRPKRPDWRLWRVIPQSPQGETGGIYAPPPDPRTHGLWLWWTNWSKYLDFPLPNPGMREFLAAQEAKRVRPCLYLALMSADPREPEFRYYWEDWRVTPGGPYNPGWLDNKDWWVEAQPCSASGWKDYFLWLLARSIDDADIKALYFDNSVPVACSNPYHGCGVPGPDGKPLGRVPLLAARDWYKRVYILMKRHDPSSIIAIHMSGTPLVPLQSFCEIMCDGENFTGYMQVMKQQKGWDNYYHTLPLDVMRAQYRNHWGPDTAFLPEFSRALGTEYNETTPRNVASVEHLLGLFLLHDSGLWPSWSTLEPYGRLFKAEDRFGWDEKTTFVPYWDLAGRATIDAAGKQPVVMSLFQRPGAVMFVPMNNTDGDLQVKLTWDPAKLGLGDAKIAGLEDIFRGEQFKVEGNTATIPIPAHNFRMLTSSPH